MNKKQAPSHVMAAQVYRVPRQGMLAQIRAAEQAQKQAHAAAMNIIDVIEATGPLTGPRTGTHPMATLVDPATRGPQAPAGIDHPIILSVSRGATWIAPLMLAMTSLLAGIAIGRAW